MNAKWTLARRPPEGLPTDGDFAWVESPIPTVGGDQMLTRTIYLSLDPYQWGRRRSGTEAVGDVCHGRTVSQVVESRLAGYEPGDFVFNTNGWQAYGLSGEGIDIFLYMFPRKLDPSSAPISTAVGVLGMLGLTAYSGLVVQCRPQAGETVVGSAASGGVGQVAGQIAKIKGCRVVGVTGGPEKVRQCLEEFGYDAAIDYKSVPDMDEALREACPDGIDAYFDCTSGAIHDAVMRQINLHARIAICGTAAYASWDPWNEGPRPERHLLVKRAIMQGFLTPDFEDKYDQALTDLMGWIRDGSLAYREELLEGIEAAPGSIQTLYSGANDGKLVIRL